MPRFPMWSCLAFVLPTALLAQQPERYIRTGDTVAIYNLVGSVRIESGVGENVTVQVTRAGGDAARLRIAQGEIGGRSTLRVVYPEDRIRAGSGDRGSSTTLRVRDDGTFGDSDDDHGRGRHVRRAGGEGRRVTIASGGGLDARADLIVQVPSGRRLAVYLAVGAVTVTKVEGDLELDTHEAEVTASGVKGGLTIDVGSGSVRVSRIVGDLSVDTGSGTVEISGVRGPALSIDTGSGDVTGTDVETENLSVATGSGEIRLTGVTAPRVSLETGSGGVSAELRRDVSSLHAETGSGNVAIRAPSSLGAAVEIETSSGGIETDFPLLVTRHSRDHMTGTIGDGKGTIAIQTGSGEVSLLKGSN